MKLSEFLTPEENEQLQLYKRFIEEADVKNDHTNAIKYDHYWYDIVSGTEEVVFEKGEVKLYSTGSWNLQAFSATIYELYYAAAAAISKKFPPKKAENNFISESTADMLEFAKSIQQKIAGLFKSRQASQEEAARVQEVANDAKTRKNLKVILEGAGGRGRGAALGQAHGN